MQFVSNNNWPIQNEEYLCEESKKQRFICNDEKHPKTIKFILYLSFLEKQAPSAFCAFEYRLYS